MVEAVLFDLDETLLDRISSVRAFVAQQFSGDCGMFDSISALANRFSELDDRNNVPKADPPPLKWSSAMFRKTEETPGQQETEADQPHLSGPV